MSFAERRIEPFDAANLESEIAEIVRARPVDYAQQRVRQPLVPLPSYVKHAEGADEVAKLTAHAVIAQYEECAKAIEQLKEPLKEYAEGHQKALDDLAEAIRYVEDSAQRCRDLGAGAFERFQKSAGVIAEVRRTCDDIRSKIEPAV